jgi:mercuric reductase
MSERYDLVIVGSGSAAFSAGIEARRQGRSVVMVEQGEIGGTCVNVGCVPSKALLAAAEARSVALAQPFPGIVASARGVDMAALIAGKDELVAGLRDDKYVDLAREYGWEIVSGEARFVGDADDPAVEVAGRRLAGAHYLVATGAAPWAPPIAGLDSVGYLTSTTAFALERLPASLIVVGGNAVGLEVAQLFARLGTRVTVVEALDRIAPYEEPEIARALTAVFADEGIEVHAATTVSGVSRETGMVTVDASVGSTQLHLRAEQILVATGRRPNTEGLALDAVGVDVGPRGEVVVDERLATTNPRVWAAGDVTGHPQFVYVAGAHGAIVVDNAFRSAARSVDYTTLPRVTFTDPNIAAVGLTEAEADAQGLDCECRTIPLEYVPRALVDRDTRGLVKLVAERDGGRVRGLHVLAHNAGDVILAGVYALQAGMTVQQIANTWAPYLTMSEGIKLAAQAFVSDVTKLSCCAA